jgi:hypothetical protein
MNTNVLNQAPQITEKFIKSIPATEFYSTVLTRPKIANIYDKYYSPNQLQYQLTHEQVLRAIMVTCFRYINMSIQDVTVLLVYGLDNLTRLDLDLSEQHLAEKLAQQNPDKNDIDVINRIIAQVVTKLPADLREKLTPLLRLRMIQKLNEDLQHMYDFMANKRIEALKQTPNPSGVAEPAEIKFFKEGFQTNSPHMRLIANNTPKTTALDNNFLKEEQDIKNSLGEKTVAELEANGYTINNIAKSSIDMRFNAGDYEQQLRAIDSLSGNNKVTKDIIPENVLESTYVQNDPQLHMDAKTKELYYFDEYSGTLTPISDVQKIKGEDITTEKQLNTLLKDYNLSKAEVDQVLHDIKNKGPITTEEETVITTAVSDDIKKSTVTYLMYGSGVALAIALIVFIIIAFKKKVGKK